MARRQHREPIVLSQMRPSALLAVLCGCILFAFSLMHIGSVVDFLRKIISALGPVFAGFVISYLLNPAAVWLEKRLNRLLAPLIRRHPKTKHFTRGLSAFLAVLLFVGSLVLLVISVSSQVVDGISALLERLPDYVNHLTQWVEDLLHSNSRITELLRQINDKFSASELGMGQVDTVKLSQKILSTLASGAAGTLGFLYDVIIGFIIAVYMLISKERFIKQFKQVLYAVVKKKTAEWIDEKMHTANRTFSTAVLGKFVDSIIIGIICYIGNRILGLPYASLIAVIVGTTNMIPFFGPIIGAIPCVLMILMENPLRALYFIIFIVALQQFDANILDPRIVGSSIGLPAFWSLFACLLGGGLFGIIGMIIGVPAFAVLYGLIKQIVAERLKERVLSGEMEPEFLRKKLGITEEIRDSGLLESRELTIDRHHQEYYYVFDETDDDEAPAPKAPEAPKA